MDAARSAASGLLATARARARSAITEEIKAEIAVVIAPDGVDVVVAVLGVVVSSHVTGWISIAPATSSDRLRILTGQ